MNITEVELGGEKFIDTINTCQLLKVCVSKLQTMVKEGKLPNPSSVGRKNFWKKSDIEAYIESKKVGSLEPKTEKNDTADEQ